MSDPARSAAGGAGARLVASGMVLGYGTGRAAAAALERLAARVAQEGLTVRGVPTSDATAALCTRLGLPLTTLEADPVLDLLLDGADEVDPHGNLLKGGGGALTREKLVALATRPGGRVTLVEEGKCVARLGATRGLALEALSFGWSATLARVRAVLPGATARTAPGAAGIARTDNGGVLFDAPLPGPRHVADLRTLADALDRIPGLVEHGLFLDLRPRVLVGRADGSVHQLDPSP